MNMAQSKNIGLCPDCGEDVRFKKMPFIGQLITCRRCTAQLEVVRKVPVVLRLAEDAWDDDEDDIELSDSASLKQRHKKAHR